MSILNTDIFGYNVVKITGARSVWKLNDNVSIIENSIDKSKNLYEEAKSLGNINAQLTKVVEALHCYPRSLKANYFFIEILKEMNNPIIIEGEILKYLGYSITLLGERVLNISNAIKTIQTEADKPKSSDIWQGIECYVACMSCELQDDQQHYIVAKDLIKKVYRNEDEIMGDTLAELLNKIKLSKTIDCLRDTYLSSLLNMDYFQLLITEIMKIIRGSYNYLVEDFEDTTIKDAISRALWLKSRKHNYRSCSASKLRNYLIKCLKQEAFYALIYEKYNIPVGETKEMLKVIKVKKDIITTTTKEPSNHNLLERLGKHWNINKVERALSNEKKIKNHIDINEEVHGSYSNIDGSRSDSDDIQI